ncbi:glycoside hydrolase family 43 protein [Paenibacillus sp. NRS-1760]|uniref:glycoside hydrolase family 43 protein n=1 Tax=Paenibacillus sp. NRS-1760 TaxID=3233902 RepID=UPI003D29051A
MIRTSEIHIRDPFILTDMENRKYYMYGTIGETAWEGIPDGFNVYVSKDLEHWSGPFPAFRPAKDFWSDHHYWAPEVHEYEGSYYMFASFKAEGATRATQILMAEHPLGPFQPHGVGPITPAGWECLDGTFYVNEARQPWIIFCREWLEVRDGQVWAMPLTADLLTSAGEPILLFAASSASWARPVRDSDEFVTDGPFLYKDNAGYLFMLWSSAGERGYAMGRACSLDGTLEGKWAQEDEPMFASDGGHGMIFQTFDGVELIALHAPNQHPYERPIFIPKND